MCVSHLFIFFILLIVVNWVCRVELKGNKLWFTHIKQFSFTLTWFTFNLHCTLITDTETDKLVKTWFLLPENLKRVKTSKAQFLKFSQKSVLPYTGKGKEKKMSLSYMNRTFRTRNEQQYILYTHILKLIISIYSLIILPTLKLQNFKLHAASEDINTSHAR